MQLSTWAVVPAGSIRGALKQKSAAAAQALAAGVAVYVAARFFGRKLLSGASSRQGVDDGHQDPRSDESALEEIMPSPLGAPGAGSTPRAAGLLRRLRAGLASVRGRVETIEELMTSNVEDARQRLDVADRQSARSVLARNRELKAVAGKLAHYEALLESRLQELEAAAIGKEIARDLAEAALLELEMQDESDDYCNNILEMNFFCAASGAGQGSVSTTSAPGAKDSASRETGEAENTQAQPAQKVPQQQGAVRTEKRVKSPAARGFTPGGKSRSASKAAAGGKKKALFPAPKMDSSQQQQQFYPVVQQQQQQQKTFANYAQQYAHQLQQYQQMPGGGGYYGYNQRSWDSGGQLWDTRGCLVLYPEPAYSSRRGGGKGNANAKDPDVVRYTGQIRGGDGDWDDAGLRRLVGEWREAMNRAQANNGRGKKIQWCVTEFDFHNNKIGDGGVEILMRFFIEFKVEFQVFKLYRNDFGDGGAFWVAEYIKQMKHHFMRELHLSDNYITETGMKDIVTAACCNVNYPKKEADLSGSTDFITPLWLRMDNNVIKNFETVLPALNDEVLQYRRMLQLEYTGDNQGRIVRNYREKSSTEDNYKGYRAARKTASGDVVKTKHELYCPAVHFVFGQRQSAHKYVPHKAKLGRPAGAKATFDVHNYHNEQGKMEEVASSLPIQNGGGAGGPTSSSRNGNNPRERSPRRAGGNIGGAAINGGKNATSNTLVPVNKSTSSANGGTASKNSNASGGAPGQQGQANKNQKTDASKNSTAADGLHNPFAGGEEEQELIDQNMNLIEGGGADPMVANGEGDDPFGDGGPEFPNFEDLMSGDGTMGDGFQLLNNDGTVPTDTEITDMLEQHTKIQAENELEDLPSNWMYVRSRDATHPNRIYYFDIETGHRTLDRADVFPDK
eukprot:g437.t1